MNIPTNEEVKTMLMRILYAANEIDGRIDTICVNTGTTSSNDGPFVSLFGVGITGSISGYGIAEVLATVKSHDPVAEKQKEIAKLESEIAAIQNQIESKQNEISQSQPAA